MKKLVLVCGILASVVSVSMGAMSEDEWERARDNCFENEDKSACYALINDGLVSVEQCNKDNCGSAGAVYRIAGRYREAILYYEKAIALGDNRGYGTLGYTYDKLQDYYNAKKYYEIACNKGNGDLAQSEPCYNLGLMYANGKGVRQDYHKAHELYKKACDMKNANACYNLGVMYQKGQGVRQDYHKAHELWKKACDMKEANACYNIGVLYGKGQGVRQNRSTAKQYFGKACDLGEQVGCDNYKLLNSQGVQ